ncbi:MAG: hypothetical protein ACI9LM_001458 [Alteromonadaceae bacterium]|jgi:hypothetical protein
MGFWRFLISSSCFFLVTLLNSSPAFSYEESVAKGGNILRAKVSLEYGYIDNFLFEDKQSKETDYLLLTPSVFVQTQFDRSLLQLNFNTSHYKYQQFSADNHSNYTFQPKYHYKFDDNKSLYFSGFFSEQYEYRGTWLSKGRAIELNVGDEKQNQMAKVGYLYGSNESVAQLNIESGLNVSRYSTRRAQTRLLDHKEYFINSSFDYLLSGHSYISADVKFKKSDFIHNEQLNKSAVSALLGMKWRSTQITQFQVLLGYQDVNFDGSTLANTNAFDWRLDMNWQPTEYTQLQLYSGRSVENPNQLSVSYRLVDTHNVNFQSKITDFFALSADVGVKQENIIFANHDNREDYFYSTLTADYQRNEWLSFLIRYSYKQLDGNVMGIDSDRHGISFAFSVSM